MTRIAVRLLLVLATLYAQLPCGAPARAATPAVENDSPAADTPRRCPCCKRAKATPAEPARAPIEQPAKPTCPPDCPCAVCSPGYTPSADDAGPPRLLNPACEQLPDPDTSPAQIGYRPPLDRPPRIGR